MSEISKLNDNALGEVAGGRQSDLSIANEVIDGKWGNGQDRINRLTAAGYDARYIQSLVNDILKQPKKPFRRNTLCIARKSDKIRAQFFREAPMADCAVLPYISCFAFFLFGRTIRSCMNARIAVARAMYIRP